MTGVVYGAGYVKFLLLAGLVRVMAQPAESHLELPDIQHIVISKISVRPLTSHAQSGTVAADTAHADAIGVVAIVAERGDAVGADPVLSAVVLTALLLQPLSEHSLDFLLGAVEHLLGHVIPSKSLVEHFGIVEPVEHLLGDLRLDLAGGGVNLGIIKIFGKSPLKPVIVRF